MDWNDDYRDFLDALFEERVEFIVVGAYALAAHGVPRATGDIDFFVRPSDENAARTMRALSRFGAPIDASGVSAADFAVPGVVYQIGVAPRRIDVITEISGVEFDEAWSTRIESTLGGRPVPFLGRDALLANKRATGRAKDLADVAMLETIAARAKRF
ncbi:MAG: hypothetical protein M3Y87_17205 [Myxococcota bacterium]|nr:hypothetical protein [Myxococcota bacterium]